MEPQTTYQSSYKSNELINHTLYHVHIKTLYDKSVFHFLVNKEKFLLDGVIVFYLKLQGHLHLDRKSDNTAYLTLESDGYTYPLFYRFDTGYEVELKTFVPEKGKIYNLMVKPTSNFMQAHAPTTSHPSHPSHPSHSSHSSHPSQQGGKGAACPLYVFAIHSIADEDKEAECKFFKERCAIEEQYYKQQSLEYSKSLVSNVVTLPTSLVAKLESCGARNEKGEWMGSTDDQINDELLNSTSEHLLVTVEGGGGRKFRPEDLPGYKPKKSKVRSPVKSSPYPTKRSPVKSESKPSSKVKSKPTSKPKASSTKQSRSRSSRGYDVYRDNPLFACS